jgi:hypothetical protein
VVGKWLPITNHWRVKKARQFSKNIFSVMAKRHRAIRYKSGCAHCQRASGFPLLSLAEIYLLAKVFYTEEGLTVLQKNNHIIVV